MSIGDSSAKRRFRHVYGVLVALALTSVSPGADAAWPPDPSLSADQLSDPSNWPSDPDYGGQWELWSWTPSAALMQPNFDPAEVGMGAGNHIDQAWQVTIGDPRVLIAVTDSGIEWDHTDLVNKAALNPGELPMPQDASGTTLSAYDANGDGVFNVQDYANDPRVTCGTTLPHPMTACMDASGAPNDPNQNGVFDAGDLIRTFSNGTDEDHNGFVDDISGWDFFKNDNDPYDDTRYGHGTGEAGDSSSETNNAIGSAGACPRCMFVPLRVGDSFIADSSDFAKAVVYATDLNYGGNTVHVVQEALGSIVGNSFGRAAIDYAYAHNRIVIASAADENSFHHNLPGTTNHVVYVHAVTHDTDSANTATTFLAFNVCSNYGGQLQLSTGASACSSQATGLTSGMAGLIESEGLAANLDPPLSAEEARQLLIETADDINLPQSQPGSPNYDTNLYPSLPGWDQRFGYGRNNVGRAVNWIKNGMIPPEVDITSPRWFDTLDPMRSDQNMVQIDGRIAASRATSFDYVIEWAPGIEPADNAWQTLRQEQNVTAALTSPLATFDISQLHIDNPGDVVNRYTVTIRIQAIAHYGGTIGDVHGEARRVISVVHDPDLLAGFPFNTGSSDESSPHIADLNGDGTPEIVIASSDGAIHALEPSGSELAGFPVHTSLDYGMQPGAAPDYTQTAAYGGTAPSIPSNMRDEPVTATVAIGDIDNDANHDPEIVVNGFHGTVYVFRHDGTPYGHGFPRALPAVPSSATDPTHILDRAIFGSPVLVDLNGDHTLEIVFGAADGKLYAIDPLTAMDTPGFPVAIHFPSFPAGMMTYDRILGTVSVGNVNGDSIPDIVTGSNERIGDGNHGAIYVVHGDGNNHAGGPFHPNWPIAIESLYFLPDVASGTPGAPPLADIDGDGLDDVPLIGNASSQVVIAKGIQPNAHPAVPDVYTDLTLVAQLSNIGRGSLTNVMTESNTFIPVFGLPTFADLTGDGVPEFIASGASTDLVLAVASSGQRHPFEHMYTAWNTHTGRPIPGMPHVIEDYTFFANSASADLSGDGYAESVIGSGGYYVHASDACGREAPGFPKFTGQWMIAAPALGDLDGDGKLEVVVATRSGYVYAWHTQGPVNGSVQWSSYEHDNRNTGNYRTPLPFGSIAPAAGGPISCPTTTPDAGMVTDAGPSDGGIVTDAARGTDGSVDGGTTRASGGCGCRTTGSEPGRSPLSLLAAAVALVTTVRRRRGRADRSA